MVLPKLSRMAYFFLRYARLAAFLFVVVYAAPLHAAKNIDVFIIAGQSNAAGRGDAKQSPDVAEGIAYQYVQGEIKPAKDPVGNAFTGSAWPQFALTYHEKTGRRAGFISTAVPGSALLLLADGGMGNWSRKGKLFNAAIAETTRAMDTFKEQGFRPKLKGILWVQGEMDAIRMPDIVRQDDYEGALRDLIRRFREAALENGWHKKVPFYIFQTGTNLDKKDDGYRMVRDVEDHVENASDGVIVVARDAITFPARRLMKDPVHYTQEGYNEMGRVGAEAVAATGSAVSTKRE